jgi:hypothetical protein
LKIESYAAAATALLMYKCTPIWCTLPNIFS